MFRATITNPSQKRTIRPIYAQHQATTWGGFLDPAWTKSFDILPGTVMARKSAEIFTPFTGAAGQKPFGLSALFVAPNLGIDEVTATGTNLFTVWVGDSDAVFEILAPAFDTTATWTAPTNGGQQLLTGNAQGKLTPVGATNANAIAELLDVETTDKILIRLNRFNLGAVTLGAGS
jgi:hypothetical protein